MPYPHSPEQHYRISFMRSRANRDEEYLLFLSGLLVEQGEWPNPGSNFFELRMKLRPSLAGLSRKALHNTFTEPVALFSLAVDHGEWSSVAPNAIALHERQDLQEFFVDFLLSFQFPGGHVKPQTIAAQLEKGIDFKPGPYISRVLAAGNALVGTDGSFSVSRRDVTWYILNDLEVTRDGRPEDETARRILHGRRLGVDLGVPVPVETYDLPPSLLDTPSDFDRYGRDLLSFLEYAGAVWKDSHSYYRLGGNALSIQRLVADSDRFSGFDHVRGAAGVSLDEVRALQPAWTRYANRIAAARLSGTFESAEVEIPAGQSSTYDEMPVSALMEQIASSVGDLSSHETGAIGEAIVVRHEVNRLTAAGRHDLAAKVQKMPDHLGIGYDVRSYEIAGEPRHIEVKTTKSLQKATINSFHLTTNEWVVAEDHRPNYWVYRVQLSEEEGAALAVLGDPVGRYKADALKMVPRNGADVFYDDGLAEPEELLI